MHSFYEVFRENDTRRVSIKDNIVCTEIFKYVKRRMSFYYVFFINVYFDDFFLC